MQCDDDVGKCNAVSVGRCRAVPIGSDHIRPPASLLNHSVRVPHQGSRRQNISPGQPLSFITPPALDTERRIVIRAGFKRGQTGQLPRASTSKGPPQKSKKLLPKET